MRKSLLSLIPLSPSLRVSLLGRRAGCPLSDESKDGPPLSLIQLFPSSPELLFFSLMVPDSLAQLTDMPENLPPDGTSFLGFLIRKVNRLAGPFF